MTQATYSIADLEGRERELVLGSFTNHDAWCVVPGLRNELYGNGFR